ncbi:MAG: DMT family transporter [Gammaproteobacteria bacterium]|nr:DMT family transporter [Gammaproteobacteria bacterium]
MDPDRRAWILAGATVALWSTVATAFELGLRVLDPATLLAGANLVAVIALAGINAARVARGRLPGLPWAARRALALGLLNPVLYYLVLFEAYDRLPGQVAQPLNYTWAITLSLLAVPFLGQKLSRGELAAMLVAWTGVVVIATGGDLGDLQTDDPIGVALALGSTLIWSAYWLLATRDHREPVGALLLNFSFALPFTLGIAWAVGEPVTPGALAFGAVVWVGLAEMAVSFVLWLLAMQQARSTAGISSLIFVSPFLSLVLLATVAGEAIRPATPLGLVLIVAGIALQQHMRTRALRRSP